MKSPPVELLGVQRPRVLSVPESVSSSAGVEAVELAASAGLILDEWQRFALECILAERADGKWAAFEAALIVPRQCGKGAVLEAVALSSLFLFGERLTLWSAHEFKTASEAALRVLALIEGSDDLRKRVARVRTSHGEEGIELLTGERLRFVARSTGSGRGFTGDRIILDEAYKLPEAALGALMPVLSSRPNPQIIYTSSAGHADSNVLRSIRDRAVKGGDPHLAYLEWSADPSLASDDRAAWAQANPALGIRISLEHVEREFAAMPEAEFARERLGIWDEAAGVDAALSIELWQRCFDGTSRVLDPVALAVDVSPDGNGSVAAAGSRSDGLTHVEVIDSRPGTQWLAPRIAELVRKWSPSCVVLDAGSPAGALLPDLDRAGVRVEKVAGREVAQAAVAFSSAVNQEQLRHLDQPHLNAAVAAAKRRMVGDLWAFGRRGSFVDISPLVASALAAWGHAQHVGRAPQIIDPWEDDE